MGKLSLVGHNLNLGGQKVSQIILVQKSGSPSENNTICRIKLHAYLAENSNYNFFSLHAMLIRVWE